MVDGHLTRQNVKKKKKLCFTESNKLCCFHGVGRFHYCFVPFAERKRMFGHFQVKSKNSSTTLTVKT